ncbi:hypothetical protein PDN61_29690 [Bacillus cereus]|nr:hypothetical protein [Bacillus cereus]MDA2497539.1 hypothetical protein [Bacillus cereus]
MKDVYTFVAKNDNTIVDCDSYLLTSEEEACGMANNIIGSYLEINKAVNTIEIFKYDNNKFSFIGTYTEYKK